MGADSRTYDLAGIPRPLAREQVEAKAFRKIVAQMAMHSSPGADEYVYVPAELWKFIKEVIAETTNHSEG
jgi:hypothetical protein